MGHDDDSTIGAPHSLLRLCGDANAYAYFLDERAQAKRDNAGSKTYCLASPETWSERLNGLAKNDEKTAFFIRGLVDAIDKLRPLEDLAMSEVRQPSIGRIVHYVIAGGPREGQHRPAIITEACQPIEHEAAPGMSNLTVFRGQADDFVSREGDPDYTPAWVGSALYCPDGTPGTWHWPERA